MSGASDNLRNNQVQLNMDGSNVCVSRQAVCETLEQYDEMLAALKDALDCMEITEKVRNPKWDGSAKNFSSIGKARAAIAKAEAV